MKKLILIVALLAMFAIGAWAQSDAGFLEGGAIQEWYCKHADGSFWALTPLTTDDATYQDAVNWCAANGYSW